MKKADGWQWIKWGAAGVLVGVIAACGGGVHTSRDFNELIPRLMGAANSNQSATQAAAHMFDVTSPDERRDAIAYLQTKKYGHEAPYMRAYELLATDPHPQVRAQAMRALAGSGDSSVVPRLLLGLADEQAEVRRDAAAGLGETWTAAAEAPLRAHLRDDTDDQVRINCAQALRHFGTATSLRALIDALDDTNVAVVYWAHESLMGLTGQKMPMETKTWLAWWTARYTPAARPTG